jgi:hypothetical protein
MLLLLLLLAGYIHKFVERLAKISKFAHNTGKFFYEEK